MAKTDAENQKVYRERKKRNDSQYLAKERARVKGYRIPIDQMQTKKKKAVRERNKLYSKAYRDRKKTQKQAQGASVVEVTDVVVDAETDQVGTVSSSTDASRQSRSRPGSFLVKMTFPNKQRKPKRSCALKRANTKVKELTEQLSSYKKKQQKWKKRYQRMKAKYGTSKQTNRNNTENSSDRTTDSLQQQSEATPSTKTRNDLRENGVSPSQLPATVVRQLTMANVLFGEIKESVAANKKQSKMNVMTSLVGGKVLKKYRCVSGLNKATGLSR
ncbi:serine/arginine-rich splicing factor 4-like [Haliotis cracherodii]|uniref:serine/arginine-rich splicing factor 4-like n=1 Tax=Haliotis cracherodii TaxID=6455 RepID=UPI0039E9C331